MNSTHGSSILPAVSTIFCFDVSLYKFYVHLVGLYSTEISYVYWGQRLNYGSLMKTINNPNNDYESDTKNC